MRDFEYSRSNLYFTTTPEQYMFGNGALDEWTGGEGRVTGDKVSLPSTLSLSKGIGNRPVTFPEVKG